MIVPGSEAGHVEWVEEFRFFMYRHWPLLDSLQHSPYLAAKLSVWQPQGSVRLQEMLARIGLPLQQCRQAYTFMPPALRSHFVTQMRSANIQQMYNLKDPNPTFPSVLKYRSFKSAISASDVVQIVTSLIEMHGREDSGEQGQGQGQGRAGQVSSVQAFNEGYDCLGLTDESLLKKGAQAALALQRTIVKKASALLDGRDGLQRLSRLYFAYIRKSAFSSNAGVGRIPFIIKNCHFSHSFISFVMVTLI